MTTTTLGNARRNFLKHASAGITGGLLADWLKKNRVNTIQGSLRFDGPSNYGDDLNVSTKADMHDGPAHRANRFSFCAG